MRPPRWDSLVKLVSEKMCTASLMLSFLKAENGIVFVKVLVENLVLKISAKKFNYDN